MKGLINMVILNFKTMKTLEILGYFKKLSVEDKLKLAVHLLESKYLHLDIDKDKKIKQFEEKLIALDDSYNNTKNFNEYKYLTYLSAQFIELSEYDKNILVTEMLEHIYNTIPMF